MAGAVAAGACMAAYTAIPGAPSGGVSLHVGGVAYNRGIACQDVGRPFSGSYRHHYTRGRPFSGSSLAVISIITHVCPEGS
jgi:hypothetical protein